MVLTKKLQGNITIQFIDIPERTFVSCCLENMKMYQQHKSSKAESITLSKQVNEVPSARSLHALASVIQSQRKFKSTQLSNFQGVITGVNLSLKELFFRSKNHPRFGVNVEELKNPPEKGYPVPKIFTPFLELQ